MVTLIHRRDDDIRRSYQDMYATLSLDHMYMHMWPHSSLLTYLAPAHSRVAATIRSKSLATSW